MLKRTGWLLSATFLVFSAAALQAQDNSTGAAAAAGQAQTQTQTQQSGQQHGNSGTTGAVGTKASPSKGNDPGNTGASKPAGADAATAGENSASETKLQLGPLDPSVPPTNIPHTRPVIGVAMGGGGALGLSEIGVLQWLEDHHIPVDVIAGTSMGSILAALYSTGHTPDELKTLLTDKSVSRVFRVESEYSNLSFRRREDEREVPNALSIGLKHGVSLRNSILVDTGLNELLDKEFLNYNDQIDFNNLPIPFRCQATDLNDAKTVTFARGSLTDAVRASASIPGLFQPFSLNGHEYVDGAILENLPTQDVKGMKADVIIAISLPLEPVGKGDLDSILGVLQRTFAVGIESNEAIDRKLATVLITPNIKGFSATDYLKTPQLAAVGYAAAEQHKAELLPYALPAAAWQAYLDHKRSLQRPPAATILTVKVKAPNAQIADAVNRRFKPLVGQPVDTDKIEALLADIRSDGRYNADYTVGYDPTHPHEPIILVAIEDKKNGPPYLDVGANIQAQSGGVTRATLDNIFIWQDLGGYGSGFEAHADVGFLTRLDGEYDYRLFPSGFFIAPKGGILREPFYIYTPGGYRESERQYQSAGGGIDVGWSDSRYQEIRGGWNYQHVSWETTTGFDALPDFSGGAQRAGVRYIYDSQDRALVPRFGIRAVGEAGYLYYTPGSPNAPFFKAAITAAHSFNKKNVVLIKTEGGTLFNRDVAQPFRFTLGGPLRVSSLATDQLRGTDYFLVAPGYLRRIATLPAPLGQSIFVGATYEAGQIRAPDAYTVTRQDISIGLIAETPLGIIAIAPAIGDAGYRKFTFSIGKLF